MGWTLFEEAVLMMDDVMEVEDISWDISIGKSSKPGNFDRVKKTIRVKVTHKPTGLFAEEVYEGILTKEGTRRKRSHLQALALMELTKKVGEQ